MATHDYDIANQSGAAFRTDLNNALAAIQSNNSNSSSPSTTVAYQWWADTTNNVLKIRNSSNNDWVELLQLDGTLTLEDGSASTPGLAFRDDLNTGIFSSAADTFNVATAGVERMELGATTIFNEDGADVDFRIEGDTEANLFFVNAGTNNVGIVTASPNSNFRLDVNGGARIGNTTDGIIIENSTSSAAVSNACRIHRNGATGQLNITSGTSTARDMIFNTKTSAGESIRIDSSGRLLLGHSSARGVAGTVNRTLQIEATDASASLSIARNEANSAGPFLSFGKTRSSSVGGTTIVNDGDTLGTISFAGADGTNLESRGADISAQVDGTPGVDDMPGRLVFSTSADGSVSTVERMRINSSGRVGIGTNAPASILHVSSGTSGDCTLILEADTDNDDEDDNPVIFFRQDGGLDLSAIGMGLSGTSADNFLTLANSAANGSISFHTGTANGFTNAIERMRIASNGSIGAPNGTNIFNASDSRVKKNVVDLDKGLSAIKSLRPVSFNWIDGFCDEEKNTLYGFIAQEVQAVDSNLIQDFANDILVNENTIENVLRVREQFLIPMLVKALQELEAKVAALEAA